jgi:hypothetical protein
VEADHVPSRLDNRRDSLCRGDVLAHGKTRTALVHPDPIHAYQYRGLGAEAVRKGSVTTGSRLAGVFYPGWVSWLLVLKAATDFEVDLGNGSPERACDQRYVDR